MVYEKITEEEQKANDLKIKREMIENQIKILNMQIGHGHIESETNLNVNLLAPNLLTKEEHQKMMEKFAKERKEAAIKRRKYQSTLEKKRNNEE